MTAIEEQKKLVEAPHKTLKSAYIEKKTRKTNQNM